MRILKVRVPLIQYAHNGIITHSYLSDNITDEWKTIRFVILECSIQIGYPIGLLIGAQILIHWGFIWVFLSTLSFGAGTGLYTIFLLNNDTLKIKSEDEEDLLSSSDDRHESEPRRSLLGYLKVTNRSEPPLLENMEHNVLIILGTVFNILQAKRKLHSNCDRAPHCGQDYF